MYEIVPTALYKPSDGKTKLSIAFAADATTEKVDYTQWSVAILGGSTTLVNYNYATIDRSITAIEGTANRLTQRRFSARSRLPMITTGTPSPLHQNTRQAVP